MTQMRFWLVYQCILSELNFFSPADTTGTSDRVHRNSMKFIPTKTLRILSNCRLDIDSHYIDATYSGHVSDALQLLMGQPR